MIAHSNNNNNNDRRSDDANIASVVTTATAADVPVVVPTAAAAAAQTTTSATTAAAQSSAGIVAAVVTSLATQPLDTVKTRIQVQGILQTAAATTAAANTTKTTATPSQPLQPSTRYYSGTWNTLVRIFREEGIISLYRGFPPQVLSLGASFAIFFPIYEHLKRQISTKTGYSERNFFVISSSVVGGWLVSSVVSAPISLVKVRLQTQNRLLLIHQQANAGSGSSSCNTTSTSTSTTKRPLGMVGTFLNVVREEGVMGLYAGFRGVLLASTLSCIYFPVYENLKLKLHSTFVVGKQRHHHQQQQEGGTTTTTTTGAGFSEHSLGSTMWITPVSSAVAMLSAVGVTYPNDVILSRLQIQGALARQHRSNNAATTTTTASATTNSNKPYYNGILDAAKKIIKQEGFAGLYKGFSTNLIRLTSGSVITFTTYELLLKLMQKMTTNNNNNNSRKEPGVPSPTTTTTTTTTNK